jgi:hypothetical protein
MTTAENKLKILSEIWLDYRDDDSFAEFVDYNDIGLPLSYFIYTEIVSPSPRADMYISETFDLLLASLGLEDDNFNSFEEMLNRAAQ